MKEEYDSEATVDTLVLENKCKSAFPAEMVCYECDKRDDQVQCYMYCKAQVCCIHYCSEHLPSRQPTCNCPYIKEEEEEE